MTDRRVRDLRQRLSAQADPAHAEFHKRYHKSELAFHGLKTPAMKAAVRAAFPKREPLTPREARELASELWESAFFEERFAALELLARAAPDMLLRDLAWLKRLSTECDGWVLLDHLACNTLGPMGLALGDSLYERVRGWSGHRHMWTRRASILVHVRPARAGELCHAQAWPTFEELLPEPEFFIRKAIGWTLRECSKQYPEDVQAFLLRVGERASGLTRREGARNLPPHLRRAVLGK